MVLEANVSHLIETGKGDATVLFEIIQTFIYRLTMVLIGLH